MVNPTSLGLALLSARAAYAYPVPSSETATCTKRTRLAVVLDTVGESKTAVVYALHVHIRGLQSSRSRVLLERGCVWQRVLGGLLSRSRE